MLSLLSLFSSTFTNFNTITLYIYVFDTVLLSLLFNSKETFACKFLAL